MAFRREMFDRQAPFSLDRVGPPAWQKNWIRGYRILPQVDDSRVSTGDTRPRQLSITKLGRNPCVQGGDPRVVVWLRARLGSDNESNCPPCRS